MQSNLCIKILQYLKAVYIGPCLYMMHQNTKYAHLLVKLSKIVGADTSLQTKLCTVTFSIEELAKRCPLAV